MELTDRFKDALNLAFQLHREQFRKGTSTPYISHLLAVTAIVLENQGSENQAIAALLHDAVEDQGGLETRKIIEEKFGKEVATIVDGLTDAFKQPKPPWRERKEMYLAKLIQAPPAIKLVSAADKYHNASTVLKDYRLVGEEVWSRFKGGKEGTLWYHRALLNIFEVDGPEALTAQYRKVIEELERLVENGREPS